MNLKYTNTWYTSQVSDNLSDYVVIDVTSRVLRDKEFMSQHPNFHKDVSPFYLGPLTSSDGLTCHIFEHFWQASKVFPCHIMLGKLTPEFFSWRKSWYEMEHVKNKSESRRPHTLLGYKDSDCLFSVYYEDGEYKPLTYVEARKKMYIPEYAKLIVKTESYKWIKSLYDSGKKIALVDFDGYNYYYDRAKEKLYNSYLNKCKRPSIRKEDYLALDSMKKVIDCGFTPAGHSFIIKMLLEGDIEVVNGKVIDHIHALDIEEGVNPSSLKKGNYHELGL